MISAINGTARDPAGRAGSSADRPVRSSGILIQLVGTRGKEELLRETPHVEFEDMAAVFRLIIRETGGEDGGLTSVLVTGDIALRLGKSADELYEEAISALTGSAPVQIMDLRAVLEGEGGFVLPEEAGEPPMFVLTTEKRVYGASALLYPGALEALSEMAGGSVFLLPSSVHEFIALRDDGSSDTAELGRMVCDINRSVVSPEERLTDSVYRYDARTGRFSRVWPLSDCSLSPV